MVSLPQQESVYSTRAPSSLVSRSRHRRHGRSHAGGSSGLPQNEFPVFSNTGDLEVIIRAGGRENRYLLHRLILAQCSGFFEASTSQQWSKAADANVRDPTHNHGNVSDIGSRGPGTRWTYELDAGTDSKDIPILVQKPQVTSATLFGSVHGPPPVRNKPLSSQPGFFRSVANLSIQQHPSSSLSQKDEDLLRDYDNMFRVFYNFVPVLDSVNIAEAYVHCKSLLNVADQYDCLDVIGPRIDHHLLQFQSHLWKQVAKYPTSYLRLGYLARSKAIYSEAIIHVVGQWPMGERHLRNIMPERVLDVLEDKLDDLAETVSRIEGKLFRLSLHNSRGERAGPTVNYMDFLAVSFFRNWLADMTSPPPMPIMRSSTMRIGRSDRAPPPMTTTLPSAHNGRMFRLIGSANLAGYLGHDECKKFLKLTPERYSRDSLKKFEKRLDELKMMAREVVRPLMRCDLHLATTEAVSYLTCCKVTEQDFCWDRCYAG